MKGKVARNILRGILVAENQSIADRALERLRSAASSSDLIAAYGFLIDNPMVRHVSLQPIFPSKVENAVSTPFLGDDRFDSELAIQKARFIAAEREILRAIDFDKRPERRTDFARRLLGKQNGDRAC